jgi:hypothetical protein
MFGINCFLRDIQEGYFGFWRFAYSFYKKVLKHKPKFVWVRKIDDVTAWPSNETNCLTEVSYKAFPQLKPKTLELPTARLTSLSFYLVPNDLNLIKRIVATIASGGNSLSDCGYSLVSDFEFKLLDLAIIDKPGSSKDREINKYHKEVVVSTIGQINKLSKMIAGNEIGELSPNELKQTLQNSLVSQYLRQSDISPSILKLLSE